jgi:hypothetical protein
LFGEHPVNHKTINEDISNMKVALKNSTYISKIDRDGSIAEAVCEDWVQIVKQYQAVVTAYSEATAELPGVPGVEFNRAWAHAESLRQESKDSRAALLEHEHEHRCSVVRELNSSPTQRHVR